MSMRPAVAEDLSAATRLLVASFAVDQQIDYFFGTVRPLRDELAHEFFSILAGVRLALRMPFLVAESEGSIQGLAMGYDCSRPEWPQHFSDRWQDLLKMQPGLAARFEHYEKESLRLEPQVPHYYLGVLAVSPSQQGKGLGRRLIEAYCALSDQDAQSNGVLLDTAQDGNPAFYMSCKFQHLGQAILNEKTQLHCLFRPKKGDLRKHSF
jgi:ribosomal protein S18 acetylase RimI-like enzyme